jgi:hypothetical protein
MHELPFELAFGSESEGITFCGVFIPKYGSLTPNEAIALSKIKIDKDTPVYEYYANVCNVLLRSRTKLRDHTLEELLNVPCKDLEELFNFTIGENRQWQEPEEEAPPDEGESRIGAVSTGGSNWLIQTSDDSIDFTLAEPPL